MSTNFGKYYPIKQLGSGYFGEVWLVKDTVLNYECALKLIKPEKVLNPDNLFQEAQILKQVENKNIVNVIDAGILPAPDSRIFIAMELLNKGSIEDEYRGGCVPLTKAKKLLIEMFRGLEFAHARGVLHRDVKPGNILIGDIGEAKLSDFGLAINPSNKVNTSNIHDYCYTVHKAPEVTKFEDFSVLSDVYACGVTMYRMLNGYSYVPSISDAKILKRMIADGHLPNRESYREFIPNKLRAIINKAISVKPTDRYQSVKDLRNALEAVPLVINWYERPEASGIRWKCDHGKFACEIVRTRNKKGRWSVDVKAGKDSKSMRRVTALCGENLNEKAAIKQTKKVLQSFTLGKQ